jgi:hypothetical protein
MGILSKQIGWSQESNLLWEIIKRLEKLVGVTSKINISSGTSVGLYSQTENSNPVTATTDETSVINGGVGTLSIPSDSFNVGDSFRADLSGVINAANNQTIRIRVKAGSVILLDSGVQSLTSAIINDVWTSSLDFTIRQIGNAGSASICSIGRFLYLKTSNGTTQSFGMNTINNTTFDTTVDNTLDVTVEWGSDNVANSIYTDIFVLSRIY